MSGDREGGASVSETEVTVDEPTCRRIRERVLQAEKEKLHMEIARRINNEIEEIIREEVD